MLLNPSHALYEGKLPSHLLDVYIRYKQGTRAIMSWLLRHGDHEGQHYDRMSINDMVRLAKTIRTKSLSMPESIDFHFRETIAARKYLSSFFRKTSCSKTDDTGTTNHEHFTTRWGSP